MARSKRRNDVAPVQPVTVFVSSPADVRAERERLDSVIESLNRVIAFKKGIVLRTFRWERDAVPSAGSPQEIILEQLGTYDIYVGIMWSRFGTPTSGAGSGTEAEFRSAYQSWKDQDAPRIMFYFCTKAQHFATEEQWEEYGKVLRFKTGLARQTLFKEYDDPLHFENLIREHLTVLIHDLPSPSEPESVAPTGPAPVSRRKRLRRKPTPATPPASSPEPERSGPNIRLVGSRRELDIVRDTLLEWRERIPGVTNFAVGLSRSEAEYIVNFMRERAFDVDLSFLGRRKLVRDLLKGSPQRQVRIGAFYLSRYPVTNRLFALFADSENYSTTAEGRHAKTTWRTFATPDTTEHPVRCVSYLDAKEFCKWAAGRLPRSEEYECVVRGSEQRLFPWGKTWEEQRCNDIFWIDDDQTSDVKKFKEGKSQHGLFDLCGNVFEWVVSDDSDESVQLLAGGSYKKAAIIRGNAAMRMKAPRRQWFEDVGFRVAHDIDQA